MKTKSNSNYDNRNKDAFYNNLLKQLHLISKRLLDKNLFKTNKEYLQLLIEIENSDIDNMRKTSSISNYQLIKTTIKPQRQIFLNNKYLLKTLSNNYSISNSLLDFINEYNKNSITEDDTSNTNTNNSNTYNNKVFNTKIGINSASLFKYLFDFFTKIEMIFIDDDIGNLFYYLFFEAFLANNHRKKLSFSLKDVAELIKSIEDFFNHNEDTKDNISNDNKNHNMDNKCNKGSSWEYNIEDKNVIFESFCNKIINSLNIADTKNTNNTSGDIDKQTQTQIKYEFESLLSNSTVYSNTSSIYSDSISNNNNENNGNNYIESLRNLTHTVYFNNINISNVVINKYYYSDINSLLTTNNYNDNLINGVSFKLEITKSLENLINKLNTIKKNNGAGEKSRSSNFIIVKLFRDIDKLEVNYNKKTDSDGDSENQYDSSYNNIRFTLTCDKLGIIKTIIKVLKSHSIDIVYLINDKDNYNDERNGDNTSNAYDEYASLYKYKDLFNLSGITLIRIESNKTESFIKHDTNYNRKYDAYLEDNIIISIEYEYELIFELYRNKSNNGIENHTNSNNNDTNSNSSKIHNIRSNMDLISIQRTNANTNTSNTSNNKEIHLIINFSNLISHPKTITAKDSLVFNPYYTMYFRNKDTLRLLKLLFIIFTNKSNKNLDDKEFADSVDFIKLDFCLFKRLRKTIKNTLISDNNSILFILKDIILNDYIFNQYLIYLIAKSQVIKENNDTKETGESSTISKDYL